MQIINIIISNIFSFIFGILSMVIKNLYDNHKKNNDTNPNLNVQFVTDGTGLDDHVCYFSHVDNALYYSLFADNRVAKIKIYNYSKYPALDVDITLDNNVIHIDVIKENDFALIIPNLCDKQMLDAKFKNFLNYYNEYHDTFNIVVTDDLQKKYIEAKYKVINCFSILPNIITISFKNTLGSCYTMGFELNKENINTVKGFQENKIYIIKNKVRKKKKEYTALSESPCKNVVDAEKRIPLSF